MPEERTIFRQLGPGVSVNRHGLRARGFTFIDLLVAVAVMTVLVTLMLPMLTGAYETARRVRCASNIRQIGLALQMYADDNNDKLPPSIFESDDGTDEHDTITVRLADDDIRTTGDGPRWDGLGYLFYRQYIDTPEVFYCPSHHGDHPYDRYADRWINQPGHININYQFRLTPTKFLTDLDGGTSLIADGMRTQSDYNHIDGNNTLKADMSSPWYQDSTRELYNSLPLTLTASATQNREAREIVANAWNILDTKVGRRIHRGQASGGGF